MMNNRPSRYPEHEKLAAISDQSQTIGQFLDWLAEVGIHRARWVVLDSMWTEEESELCLDITSIQDLLAEYFDIDQDVITAEKWAMLDDLRARQQ